MRPEGTDGDMTSAGGLVATVLNADIAIRFAFSPSPIWRGPQRQPNPVSRFEDSAVWPDGIPR